MKNTDYIKLAKLFTKEHPELAKKLLERMEEERPRFQSFEHLPGILDFFCRHKGITQDTVIGKEGGRLSTKTDNKHVFVAVVVKLFSPATLGPTKEILMIRLRHELSMLLETRGDRISRIIANVRFYLKTYKDFAGEVEESYQAILSNKMLLMGDNIH